MVSIRRSVLRSTTNSVLSACLLTLTGCGSVEPESTEISAENRYSYLSVRVGDTEMAYIDVGSGAPVVLVHGNPTASYMWRNVVPYLESDARILVPDLIGYGASGKSPRQAYRFVDHADYFAQWMDQVLPNGAVTFIGNDWGVQLTLDWGRQNPERVRAVAFMEGTVKPRAWAEFPEATQERIRFLRSPAGREQSQENDMPAESWIDPSLPRELTEAEKAAYNTGFARIEDRLPVVTFPAEIPMDGEPADVAARVEAFGAWLAESEVPKLFVNVTRPVAITEDAASFVRTWPNLTEITIEGGHYLPEENPHDLGRALADWYQQLPP